MAKRAVNTRIGELVDVQVRGVAVVFTRVTSDGSTTVEEPATGPRPPKGVEISKYYRIETSAKSKGKIMIRIILPRDVPPAETRKLLQWDEKNESWDDITTHYNSELNVIIGKTEHLSIFGVI